MNPDSVIARMNLGWTPPWLYSRMNQLYSRMKHDSTIGWTLTLLYDEAWLYSRMNPDSTLGWTWSNLIQPDQTTWSNVIPTWYLIQPDFHLIQPHPWLIQLIDPTWSNLATNLIQLIQPDQLTGCRAAQKPHWSAGIITLFLQHSITLCTLYL